VIAAGIYMKLRRNTRAEKASAVIDRFVTEEVQLAYQSIGGRKAG
jgi:hypothetical protein